MRQLNSKNFDIGIEGATIHSGFALCFSNNRTNGSFIEIGAGHWQNDNNTYVLEKHFNWNGIAIEINPEIAKEYNENRSTKCLNKNAINFNWDKYLEENNFAKRIDYLQIDIDNHPKDANLLALLNFPLSRYRFNAITLEHFANIDTRFKKARDIQREILYSYGYKIIAEKFCEDWWIDDQLGVPISEYIEITSESWNGKFI